MAKQKAVHHWSSGGDWSETGTFIRKPTTGWIHKDEDLTDGSAVRYRVAYLGCLPIVQSMRTLQYNVRTQVTKEAITRLAEKSERVLPNKKRKVSRQISRLLGDIDDRNEADVILHISIDYLQMSHPVTKKVLQKHSLTSISFASGGEKSTEDFIGYVAKDTIHERACHVFHCAEGTAPLVLATVGQAFELRFKIFLNSSSSQIPGGGVVFPDTREESGYGAAPDSPIHHGFPPLPPLPEDQSGPIYSDVPDEPPPPPPHKSSHYQMEEDEYSQPCLPSDLPPQYETAASLPSMGLPPQRQLPRIPPPLTNISPQPMSRLRVYSDLPGFPNPEGEAQVHNSRSHVRTSINPYDTMTTEGVPTLSPQHLPQGDSSEEAYQLVQIHQQPPAGRTEDHIDLTPVTDQVYSNMRLPEPPERPKPAERPKKSRVHRDYYEDPVSLEAVRIRKPTSDDYEDPDKILRASIEETDGGVAMTPESPAFDDTIYATSHKSQPTPVDPLAPLPLQPYFHGRIQRADAESMVAVDGDFLVRESINKPGQYVLTGRSGGLPQHLLLIDRNGRVKSRDREFDSVPHLIKFFSDNEIPLMINNNDVFLATPVPH